MNLKKKKIILTFMFIIIFVFMYMLNSKTQLVSDDFVYQFVFQGRYPSDATRLISNPLDIFISMANHWIEWGGRVSVHFLLQFSFMLGITFFNVFNSLMFILLGILIYKHICDDKKINIILYLIIYFSLFLFFPQPKFTLMWKSGAANYLWSSVLILIMSLIYKKHYGDENKINDNIFIIILLFLYGLIVGCANENSGCALIVLEILFIVSYKFKYRKIPRWAYSGLIGTIISFILLLISPGNYKRAEIMYPNVSYKFSNIFEYIIKITRLSYDYLFIIIVISLITFLIIFKKQNSIYKYFEKYFLQICYFAFVLISIYSLVLSPAYPERSWTFAFVFLVIFAGTNIVEILKLKQFNEVTNKVLIFTLIILSFNFISTYQEEYITIRNTYNDVNMQIAEIYEQKEDGITDIVIDSIPTAEGEYNAYVGGGLITSDRNDWQNRWIARYYEVAYISVDD